MSVSIFLIKFALDSGGAYVDGRSDLIESVTVPSDLFHNLVAGTDGIKRSQLKVFEDESRRESFQIGCYLPDDASRLRERLREVFLDKLRNSAAEVGAASVNQLDAKPLEAILGAFRALTNLDALLTQKLEGFRDDDSMVVRVDTNE
ncbi:hypothetical protein EN871_09995 [bacterium M00.F.Ca.ET.228.01.1.1]|nr:hypothetical protein EN871_09995 [bacterium M00.F.Ca.ET.228.01.1.1]TGS02785.1 hypothetical protein EN834_09990 [bacterium M00.F.Ca.ET.191.01.1.1]TGU06167.1 hypothetical protein EN798_14070 [bacterium M00.F.Ca.ET.155.01.1.1]